MPPSRIDGCDASWAKSVGDLNLSRIGAIPYGYARGCIREEKIRRRRLPIGSLHSYGFDPSECQGCNRRSLHLLLSNPTGLDLHTLAITPHGFRSTAKSPLGSGSGSCPFQPPAPRLHYLELRGSGEWHLILACTRPESRTHWFLPACRSFFRPGNELLEGLPHRPLATSQISGGFHPLPGYAVGPLISQAPRPQRKTPG